MVDGIKISELDPSLTPSLEYVFAAIRNGKTEKLSLSQVADLILALIVDGSPEALDTLNELSAALGDDANFAATVLNALDARLRLDASQSITAAQKKQGRRNLSAALLGHLWGLTLSNNAADATNDIDFGAGECSSLVTEPILMEFGGETGVQLDVVYGSGKGGRFDASISDGTWHCFLGSNGTTTIRGFSKLLNPTTAPNWPAGYSHYRRIGSILRVSGGIAGFIQNGNEFLLKTIAGDFEIGSMPATEVLRTISVPSGVSVIALLHVLAVAETNQNARLRIYTPGQADEVLNGRAFNAGGISVSATSVIQWTDRLEIRTNTSSQVITKASGQVGVTMFLSTTGWIDDRGRLS